MVNLCCGRNPWKRASTEDSTFRAFLKDPHFLRSILPLSPELNSILRRIFECDPLKRITLQELRRLIVECPRFTVRSGCTYSNQPTSPRHRYQYADETFDTANYIHYPSPPSSEPIQVEYSLSAVSDASLSDDDSSLSSSSSSSSEYSPEYHPCHQFRFVAPPVNYWGSFIPITDVGEKALGQHQPLEPIIADA
jgi:serine/threonine protein kinase